jgi:hypothetical protein
VVGMRWRARHDASVMAGAVVVAAAAGCHCRFHCCFLKRITRQRSFVWELRSETVASVDRTLRGAT